MQYRILATDLDNTLIPFDAAQPRPAVLAAAKKLREAGVPLVMATGRTYSTMYAKLRRKIGFDYAVCCNGGHITDAKGNTLAETPLTNEEMYALVDFCEDYNYPLAFGYRDNYYAYTEYETIRAHYASVPGSMLTVLDGEDQDRHLIDMPHAGFCMMPGSALEQFKAKYGYLKLRFLQVGGVRGENMDGWRHYDVVRDGVSKAAGLARLCGVLNLPVDSLVTAGDGENDVDMLQAAGLGCCMDNGVPAAKAAADRVIPDVREDGLAALIEELWFDGPAAVPSGRDFGPAKTV